MSKSLREVFERREVLLALAQKDIRVRYKQSVMGTLWAFLMPLVIVSAGMVVRLLFSTASGTTLARADIASVTVRAVPWAFFAAAIRFATLSLVSNSTLITKIYLPREIFPLAAIMAQLLDFVIAGAAAVVIVLALGYRLSALVLWVPLLVLVLLVLTAGLGILLSAASLFFRDVKYLVEVLLTFAIFFTPVLYDADMFVRWKPVLMLNPLSSVLEGLSDVLVFHRTPPLGWLAYSAGLGLVLLVGSLLAFRKLEPLFAESV